jgi:predicted helicase
MLPAEIQQLRRLTTFEALVAYLRDELDWPIETEDADRLTFEYRPAELGIDEKYAVKIETIRQIRPLADGQPWGIFYIEFESKRLPVLVLRRILHRFVQANRPADPNRPAWQVGDLLFISAQGPADQRSISFAHFRQAEDGRQELRTFSWDVRETHLYYIKNMNLHALRWPSDDSDPAAWRAQWAGAFLVRHREVPQTAEMLATAMARIARDVREAVTEVYAIEHAGGPLHQLHLSLKMDLINDLSEADFADMYAQTVTYGLFAARATRSGSFNQADAPALIAHANPFLRELLEQMTNQPALDLEGLGVSELTDLLGRVDMEAILRDFGRQQRGEDPVIHFYETFMQAYDPQQRTRRGEFYTPDPVVSFIVRSVDYLLRTEFACPDGLATAQGEAGFSPIVLDPATGTGTFLKYVVEVIWESFYEKHKRLTAAGRKAAWNRFVRAQVLPRLYGFELKMSPYTIAHMKVGLALQEKGFEFEEGERLQIYLTNALQPAHEIARVDTPALAHEAGLANQVKNDAPVTVVIGNPPYAGHSANASRDSKGNPNFIGSLLQDYYKVDGKPLGEKNPKWLQDDYVKFLRFAQWQIAQSGAGIVAMITNHGYLDNPTFRGMRQQLLQTFDEIFVLDLHGNTKKKETAPDGSKDENVFDIQQGVAVCLMVKRVTPPGSAETVLAQVSYAGLYGLRKDKYEQVLTHHPDISAITWQTARPQAPYYLFVPQDSDLRAEYDRGWKVTDIFPVNSVGIVTARDKLTIRWTPEEVLETITDFVSLPVETARNKYDLGRDVEDWTVISAQEDLRKSKLSSEKIVPVLYRPFDTRFTYYTGRSRGFICRPRPEVMRHMLVPHNYALITVRKAPPQSLVNYFFITRHMISNGAIRSDNQSIDLLMPLYIAEKISENRWLFPESTSGSIQVNWNISAVFIKQLQKKVGLAFIGYPEIGDLKEHFSPLDVLHYAYSVFYSPRYRNRYAEFLKIDFPRLPLTGSLSLFRALCALGKELTGLHLLEAPSLEQPITRYLGEGDDQVARGYPKYEDGAVRINPGQGFQGVPQAVWEFHIGGYQVCEKWLKDRRGRQLSPEDIAHYQKIVVALHETIRLMGEIDQVIEQHGGWPIR